MQFSFLIIYKHCVLISNLIRRPRPGPVGIEMALVIPIQI